jgi:Uma2 family endonuclease
MEETVELIELKYDRFRFNDDEFYDFCRQNDGHKFERDANGNIFIMVNTGGKSGILNSELNFKFVSWNRNLKMGKVFDSSSTFILASNAARSPDVAWLSNETWNKLTIEQQTKFPPVCPDFVLELISVTDNLKDAQKKMTNEWIENGCKLGWLINPKTETTYIYRENGEMEIVNGFDKKLSGEDVLVGFELDLGIL